MIQTLNAFIESRRRTPFQWGVNDCCLFAADWALVATGQDPALDWRHTYRTALGANRLLNEAGGVVSLANRALLPLGWVPIHPQQAKRGSIAALGPLDSVSLGVVAHPGVAGVGHDGLLFVPTSSILAAWIFP